jgi:hypothetical protein
MAVNTLGTQGLAMFGCNLSIPCASKRAKTFWGVYSLAVTYIRKFGALVILLTSLLSPAMACAVADMPMTAEERACCQMMGSECAQSSMPASHGCCQEIPGNVYDKALNTKAAILPSIAAVAAWFPIQQIVLSTASVSGWYEHRDSSPPKSPPPTISILRI